MTPKRRNDFVIPLPVLENDIASLVLRFYDPDSGTITIDGVNSKEMGLEFLRNQMAIVPQDVILFGGTIRENIEYGKPGASLEEVEEAARRPTPTFSWIFLRNTIPLLESAESTGGQRQRIAIARAVLKDPSILILDEATISLDSESERLVQEALDKLMVGRTSLVIAHHFRPSERQTEFWFLTKDRSREWKARRSYREGKWPLQRAS